MSILVKVFSNAREVSGTQISGLAKYIGCIFGRKQCLLIISKYKLIILTLTDDYLMGCKNMKTKAGAELCQAQEKHGLAELALHCKKLWSSSI